MASGYSYNDKYGISHVTSDAATASQYASPGTSVSNYTGNYGGGYALNSGGNPMSLPGSTYNSPNLTPYDNSAKLTPSNALSGKALDFSSLIKSGTNPTEAYKTIYGVGFDANGSVAQNTSSNIGSMTSDQISKLVSDAVKGATPTKDVSKDFQSILPQIQGLMGQYSAPYEKLLKDMLAAPSAFTMPSQSELMGQATTKADLQTSPLLAAIQSRLTKEGANYQNTQGDIRNASALAAESLAARKAKEGANYQSTLGDIDTAYSGVGDQARNLLEEVARNSIETSIAAGMGRSGKGEYLTAKGSTPIIQQVAQAGREQAAKKSSATNSYNAVLQELMANELGISRDEAAKLASAANLYGATTSDLNAQSQNISGQQGKLTSSVYDDLMRYYNGLGVQQEAAKWGQGMDLANLANTANMGQQNLLGNILGYYFNG